MGTLSFGSPSHITSHTSCSGLLPASNSSPGTPSDHVLGYQLYSEGPEPKTSPLNETLTTGVSNYITNGAGINIPSESLGFYFSGMTTEDGSLPLFPIEKPMVAAQSFIEVRMSNAQEATWTNLTWPTGVLPRANAQLVWLPVSSQGVLVVIGGVINPQELMNASTDTPSQTSESQLISPTFMTSLPVYDIGTQQWFIQNISGEVPDGWQLTEFCSVVAKAAGSSSFEIFIYGGYDGLLGLPYGDVWVLSIPSFTWVLAYQASSAHTRSSHSCVKPYPDQMFVIGGENIGGTSNGQCFNQIIDVFNLSSLTWLERYDPTVYANYSIPSVVANSISATATAIAMDPTLSAILGSKYEKNITTYYPYLPLGQAVTNPPPKTGHKWLPIVLGVVLGVAGLLIFVALAIWWCLHRKGRKSVTSDTQPGDRVDNWIDGVAKPDASVTTTELEDSGSSPVGGHYEVVGDLRYPPPAVEIEAVAAHRPATSPRSVHLGAGRTERYEMHALERGSPDAPVEMATSYQFPDHREVSYHFRDHSLYPRNPTGASQTMSPSLEARSTTSGDASAPSPYTLPRRLVEADDSIDYAAADSSPLSSPDQSPPQPPTVEHGPSHKRKVSSMSSGAAISATEKGSPNLDALERVSGLGYSNSRPMHTRNMSSLSSGIAQLPSPGEPVPAEEDQRRSILLSNLPSPPPAPDPMQADLSPSIAQPLVSHHQSLQRMPESRNSRSVVMRKQVPGRSAFTEEEMDATVPRTI
jgi:Kelch motif